VCIFIHIFIMQVKKIITNKDISCSLPDDLILKLNKLQRVCTATKKALVSKVV